MTPTDGVIFGLISVEIKDSSGIPDSNPVPNEQRSRKMPASQPAAGLISLPSHEFDIVPQEQSRQSAERTKTHALLTRALKRAMILL